MKKTKLYYLIGGLFYAGGIFNLFKGIDKITQYSNPESYLLESKNAYVGGDAYNYIINANYSTGYFVLAVGCVIVGTMFALFGLFVNNYLKNLTNNISTRENDLAESLPNI